MHQIRIELWHDKQDRGWKLIHFGSGESTLSGNYEFETSRTISVGEKEFELMEHWSMLDQLTKGEYGIVEVIEQVGKIPWSNADNKKDGFGQVLNFQFVQTGINSIWELFRGNETPSMNLTLHGDYRKLCEAMLMNPFYGQYAQSLLSKIFHTCMDMKDATSA
jgi:hypothetical protein